MGGRYGNPVAQYLDDNANPLSGGKLYFYESGTTTPQNTYADDALTTPNANPVILDSAGRIPNIFADATLEYTVVLKTSAEVTVWTKDNVTFVDISDLIVLINELETLVTQVTAKTLSIGAISNPSCDAAGVPGVITLSNTLTESAVGGWWVRVGGTVSAGTSKLGRLSGLGAIESQMLASGVTGDSSSIVEFVNYMSAEDAIRYANNISSLSVATRQESGLTATWTLALYKANSFNNFSADTLISSISTSVSSSVNQTLSLDGVSMGDCENGLKFVFTCQPGGAFVTKDFYLTDLNFVIAGAAGDYTANPASLRRLAVFFKSLTGQYFFSERATAPAGSVPVGGGTIGSAASAATVRANADCRDLYVLRWDTYSNALAPVSGGRGASANADFDANKTMTLFDLRGKFLRAYVDGGSVDVGRVFGSAQDDALQNITGTFDLRTGGINSTTGPFSGGGSSTGIASSLAAQSQTITFDASAVVRTSTETRPTNGTGLLCVYL